MVGGKRFGDKGYFVEPTLLVNTNSTMKVKQEEIFCPVVCTKSFTNVEDVITKANNNIYGLAAVCVKDLSMLHRLAAQLRAVTFWINCQNIFGASFPFGGYKQSRWGREMGHEALNLFTEVKSFCAKLA